jgi:hypothetical protein
MKSYPPGKVLIAEQHRQVENAKPACKQHRCCHGLNSELEIWPCVVQIVVYTEQKYEGPRQQNRE